MSLDPVTDEASSLIKRILCISIASNNTDHLGRIQAGLFEMRSWQCSISAALLGCKPRLVDGYPFIAWSNDAFLD